MRTFFRPLSGIALFMFVPIIFLAQKPLLAGDRFPATLFNLTEGDKQIRVPDGSKKLVLLDFWDINCKSCVAAFPKMEKLQEQFKDQVQVILVNPESPDSTLRFFARKSVIKKPSLPMISGSKLMSSLVPWDFVPWHVWIDQQGVVKFIAEGFNANAENIRTFIETGTGPIRQLYASAIVGEENMEQKAVDAAVAKKVQYYSWISKAIPGRTWSPPAPGKDYTIVHSRRSIVQLFRIAFGENGKRDLNAENSIVLEVADPSKYREPEEIKGKNDFRDNNYYNFFLMVPESRKKEKFALAQEELCQVFNVTAGMEMREIECYALVSKDEEKKYCSSAESLKKKTPDSACYSNVPVKELIRNLNQRFQNARMPQPVINATGYSGNLNIVLSRAALYPLNIDLLRQELGRFGLDLIKLYAVTDVLIIKEKENK